MLSEPINGWCNINIGNWSDRASYLTDVPNDILQCVIEVLDREHSCSGSIHCDAEGWDYYILLTYRKAYIIEEKDESELIGVDINIFKLAQEVCADIEENIEKWVYWDCNSDLYTEEDVKIERDKLLKKIAKIKELLEKEEKHREKIKKFQRMIKENIKAMKEDGSL